jgi:serine protease inhibitor
MVSNKKILKMLGLLLALLLLFLFSLTWGCSLFESKESLAAPVEELDVRLVRANNGFGFNLFRELAAAKPESNLLISPASILTALVMTYNGAEGETRAAMEETLQLREMTMTETNKAFTDLLTVLRNPDPKVELTIANSLWAREGITFNDDFLQRNRDHFGAEINTLDFNDAGAANLINYWVKEKTKNKIEGIVDPPINPDTILFLINAIYFKGDWSEPFDAEMTGEMPFHLPDGTVKQHPMMFHTGDFRYSENELFQAVSLPYGKNERVSMYLFLPAKDFTLEQFYAKLNATTWEQWLDSFLTREGRVGLPRFKFSYETSLNDALKALGMGIAFDESAADFSGMRPIPPRLVISEVKHKTFIEVNEEGTEAAAVTSVEVGITAMPELFTMILDRPFFFAIVDDMTGTILFMGSVMEPL